MQGHNLKFLRVVIVENENFELSFKVSFLYGQMKKQKKNKNICMYMYMFNNMHVCNLSLINSQ